MVRIVSDSTCDLSPQLVERYGISIIPLHILLGEKEYEDGINIDPDKIYKWSDDNKTTPKTSAPSMETVINTLKPLLDNGNELVCFAISEDMSTAANVMRLAADELDASEKVHVIDSMNLSTGIGLLVIEAAIMANEGKDASYIVEKIEALRPMVRASFVVDTLVYLYRGGRCNGLSAMVGSALKLHPMITVVNGKMVAGKKYRGNLSKVITNYSKDLEEELRHAKKDRVFITHSGCDREIVNAVREYLEGLGIFNEILETRAGGVVSSHCGPGTLGVLFIAQ
jgi:DegV family protein with EDD domain